MSGLVDTDLLSLQRIERVQGWVASWNCDRGFQIHSTARKSQPQLFDNSICSTVFDGFVQNRRDLCSALELSGAEAFSDARLVCESFSRWGEDAIKKLRGVYLLAIWNKKSSNLLFVRDHCGIYPAFYAIRGGEFIFSTLVEEIVQHPAVSRTLNRSVYVDFLCHRRPIPEETFYSDVKRVLAAHCIRFSSSKTETIRYWWNFPEEGHEQYITDPESSGFDEMLEEAVDRCVRIGNPGIFLSGGLDSVSIASVAAAKAMRNETPTLRGFSLGFPHPDCNEIDRQVGVARGLGIELDLTPVEAIVGDRGLLSMALELGKEWSQPMWNTWQPLYMVLGRKASEAGCEVIMTGAGGDEWLTVSDTLTADLIRRFDVAGMRRLVPILLRSYKLPTIFFLRHILWKSGLRLLLADYARRAVKTVAPETLRDIIRKRLRASTVHWVAADPILQKEANERVELLVDEYMSRLKPRGKYPFYSNSFSNHFIHSITSMEMEQHFEASKHMGVTLVHPYFDPDLIQLLLKISPEVLQQGGMEKGIVRQAVAKRFPGLKFEKQKKVSAMGYWQSIITVEGRRLFSEGLNPKRLIEMGIVNEKVLAPVMEQSFTSTNAFHNTKIWDLLCLEGWTRSHTG